MTFTQFLIKTNDNITDNIFDDLFNSVEFEDIAIGRKGAIITDDYIVRSTTNYNNAIQNFKPIHTSLKKTIENIINNTFNNILFNNAMIEVYDNNYTTMKYHSDMALDLVDDSIICIYSCYIDKNGNKRKLLVRNKITNEENEIILEHNSIVYFSTETNKQYLHKIIGMKNDNNIWLGITFRQSKTKFGNLTFATEEQKRELYKLRKQENLNINFSYPEITYTISKQDITTPCYTNGHI